MRATSRILAALLVAALAAGCQEAPTSTGTIDLDSPVFNFSNGPSDPGPIVMRSQIGYGVLISDSKRGQSAVFGVDPVQLCLGNAVFDLVDLQRIDVPEDANRVNDIIQGRDMVTSVWPFTGFSCARYTTTAPLATGTADLNNTDNDVFIFLNPDSKNHNAFGWRAHGRLTDASGKMKTLNAHENCLWDGHDPDTFKCENMVNL